MQALVILLLLTLTVRGAVFFRPTNYCTPNEQAAQPTTVPVLTKEQRSPSRTHTQILLDSYKPAVDDTRLFFLDHWCNLSCMQEP